MVVVGQVLRQLEARHVVDRWQPPHDPAALEDRQVAVERALGLVGAQLQQLGDAHGTPGAEQALHEVAPAGRVALAGATEPLEDEVVGVDGHGRRIGPGPDDERSAR